MRRQFLESLSPEEAAALWYTWEFWARPAQVAPPSDWQVWLIMAGRGFGKTRSGAEYARQCVESGRYGRGALVARTAADVRDVIVEGESGILAISPPWFRPEWNSSKRRLTWPNGAIATTYSADQPDQLRGPQHDFAWADELAAWRYEDAWDQLSFGLRLGLDPRCVVTTTPRPTKLIRDLVKQQGTVVTGGSTYENIANLAPTFINSIITKYEGTRLGRQELLAQILDDVPGALWTLKQIDKLRVATHPQLARVVVAIDPAVSSTEESAETGIVAAGLGSDGHGYILDDATLRGSPGEWATAAIELYRRRMADRIIGEVNNGGEMVGYTLMTIDHNVSYKAVHASRGKQTRAEPIAALYERGRVHHVGAFAELEDQMCNWVPNTGLASPDRLDALVWGLTELFLEPDEPSAPGVATYEDRVAISPF